MKKKLCIVGLIGLFAWNALLGAFGGLLLCIHQDLAIHIDDAFTCATACANVEINAQANPDAVTHTDTHAALPQTKSCLAIEESCVDIDLVAEPLPATRLRLQSLLEVPLPQISLFKVIGYPPLAEPMTTLAGASAAPRVPPAQLAAPGTHWLTDFYLPNTILRV